MAGLIAITTVSVLVGIAAARAGNVAWLRYCLLFAVLMALVIAYGVVVRFRRVELSAAIRVVERNGIRGTEIRYSTWQFTILVALMACFALLCATAAIDIWIRQDEGFPGASVLFGALGLVFASFGAAAIFGRISRGGITLSNKGITQRGWSFTSSLEWASIAGVKPAFNGYPVILVIGYANSSWDRRYTTRIWRIDRLPPVPMIEVDCRKFDIDPKALYGYIRTYVDFPETRSELGTEAALTRASQSHIPTN
ncbi:hypothetical protein BI330_24255 [Mycobacterium sp. CBMA 623]|nr:hypothetical protein [Mycobacteroides sp. CBMA 326]